MTPLGHAAVSLLAARGCRVRAWPVVVAGTAMDLDFLFLWHAGFNEFHRVVTHNVPIALAIAGLAAVWSRSLRVALAALLAACLHLLADAVLDGNPSNGVGVALLWPFSSSMWAPFNLLVGWMDASPAGWSDLNASARIAVLSLLYELPLIGLAALWSRRLSHQ